MFKNICFTPLINRTKNKAEKWTLCETPEGIKETFDLQPLILTILNGYRMGKI